MKRTKMTFLLSEIFLFIMLLLCVHRIFSDEKPQKRVAVIVEKSGDEKWDSFINGLKQAAEIRNIHLIICNTDEIEDAQEEKSLICEQLDNQVDAFIIQAAPGKDTGEMLREIRSQKPVLLVANDVLKEQENGNHPPQYQELPVVMPDNYSMGYALGEDLRSRNDIRGKKIGIVSGFEETECSREREEGVLEALSDSGCEIQFHIYTTYDMAITEKLRQERTVDYLIVLETGALEQIAGMYAQESENRPGIYGIGNSIRCVYYLDEAVVEGLVAADGYDMGYQSVLEISGALGNQLYAMKNRETDYRLLHKEDIFREEVQQFLHTYD